MSNISEQNNIGELVAADYRTASVFSKYGIDFCCNGNRSIGEACNADSIDANKVVYDLNEATTTQSSSSIDYSSWPLDLLADYVEKKHHRYVEAKTGEIKPYLSKIARVHGGRHPELVEVEELFNKSAGELAQHMKKEELILFPFIRKMVKAKDSGQPLQVSSFGTVENPIDAMKHDHNAEGERFRKISALTNGYTVPEDGCTTYRVTLSMLKEFEEDLHLHIHLENNILFPKSIELEKQLN
ncbi:MAG: iron-sulfur cluster repair di-iron protein [Crocinitomicaceae bacterium]|nr:iron-sulfur cluster repair di-iron protein [Crocinitomicaceae bacterium]